ncbi:MAG TPA: NADPH-dependent FMN reductase [Holophagaceae bacterium]
MNVALVGGSLRPESLNGRLLGHLARELKARGHAATSLAGDALAMPLYAQGLEVPAAAQALQQSLLAAQGLVIVSPEYNAGIPGHLKNAVDWVSTLNPNPWPGLPVLLCAASPGAFGGARGLLAWRATLANLGALALPEALTVPHADGQLDPEGAPSDPRTRAQVARVLDGFLALVQRLGR